MTRYINLKRAQNEAWVLYDSWRKTGINSPAFRCKVRFSLLGWRHLIGSTGHKKRTSDDTFRRLKLLPHVKEIIEKSKLIQNIEKKKGRLYYALEGMIEVEEAGARDLRKIRVVIVEDYKKIKYFYLLWIKNEKGEKNNGASRLGLLDVSIMESKNPLAI
jgi:hypothetical protein